MLERGVGGDLGVGICRSGCVGVFFSGRLMVLLVRRCGEVVEGGGVEELDGGAEGLAALVVCLLDRGGKCFGETGGIGVD